MVLLASEAISSLLVIVCFFAVWLMSTFPRALLITSGIILILFLLPFKVLSLFSILIAIVIIVILTVVTELIVNHEQALHQRELTDDEQN